MKNFHNSLMLASLFFLLGACRENVNSNTAHSMDINEAHVELTRFAVDVDKDARQPPKETMAGEQDLWLKSLLTDTPQEGRELAIQMARKSIGAIQTDPEVRKRLRDDYAEDTRQLISSAEVIAIEFQTVAAANNYWRDKK